MREAGLKVVITGEGADELFGGYDIYRENKVRRFWAKVPESELRPLLFARLNEFLGKDLKRSGAFLFGFYKRGLEDVDDPLYSHRLRFANTGRALRLLDEGVVAQAALEGESTARVEARLPDDFDGLTPLGKAQYLEIVTFLDSYLLHSQGDRMLMGNSIEGRFPFLDYRVAEFAAALPDTIKVRGLEEKYLLRKAAEPFLPPEISARRKRPYRAPIVSAFVGPGAPGYVRELLDPDHLALGRPVPAGSGCPPRRQVRDAGCRGRRGDGRDGPRRHAVRDAPPRPPRRKPGARLRGRADPGRRR